MEQSLKVDGRALFSTSAKTDEGSQKNKKTDSNVAKSPPGGADIRILKSLAGYLWMKDNPEFRFRVVAALCLLVGAKVSYIVTYEIR